MRTIITTKIRKKNNTTLCFREKLILLFYSIKAKQNSLQLSVFAVKKYHRKSKNKSNGQGTA